MSYLLAKEILWKAIVKNLKYKSHSDTIQFLRSISLFNDLSNWQLARLSEILYHRTYEEGEFVFNSNHPGAALFLIHTGEVVIEIERSGRVYSLATLTETQCMGDLALVDYTERTASARANKKTTCYALYRKDLEKMMVTDADITCKIYKAIAVMLAERLKSMNEAFEKMEQESLKVYDKIG